MGQEINERVPYCVWEGRYLLDVGLSFCAMPRLGLCVATALGAVTGSRGWGIACCLSHGVFYKLRREDEAERWSPGLSGYVCEGAEGGDCRD